MQDIIEGINKIKKELLTFEAELKNAPFGHLNRRGKFYYQAVGRKEIGITKNPTLIGRLCRKKLVQTMSEQHLENLANPLGTYKSKTPLEMIRSFSKTYQNLPLTYYYHHETHKWLEKKVVTNQYPMQTGFQTVNGSITTRSKSESIIANLLQKYNLLFHYDAELALGGKTKFPDFQIINPFTGKTFIWEHFGAINQPRYEEAMHEKIELYAKNGYIIGENIIFTFEIDIMTEDRIKKIIEEIILS